MNDPARKKSSTQNKFVRALETRNEDEEELTALRSSREDREGNNTRVECNEIFLPVEPNVEDAAR